MKISKLLLGAAIVSLGLASCSDDKLDGVKDPGQAEASATRFMSVALCSPSQGGRADEPEFATGTKDESAINTLDFIFYDINGTHTGKPAHIDVAYDESGKATNVNIEDGTYSPNVNRILTSVVPVELTQGENLPAYVMCLVNARQASVDEFRVKDMSALRDYTNEIIAEGGYLVMSNSVYYGTDKLTGQDLVRMSATPIDAAAQLYKDAETAEAAIKAGTEGALVDIYVERKAAKVGLTMQSTAVVDYKLVDNNKNEVVLKFVPEYWFVNAHANNTYMTKRFGVQEANGNLIEYPEYNQMNNAFAGATMHDIWNDPDAYRSYWGCSPSYYKNTYPEVSDQVKDIATWSPANSYNSAAEGEYNVTYYSYNQVKNGTATSTTGMPLSVAYNGGFTATSVENADASNGYLYTLETTVASNTIRNTNANPAAAVASMVIVGHYEVNDATPSFYILTGTGNGTYFADNADALAYLAKTQRTLFVKNGDDYELYKGSISIFAVSHPDNTIRTAMNAMGIQSNIAGNIVSLRLVSAPAADATTQLYYYDTASEGYVQVTSSNLANVNAALYQGGTLRYYNNGRAFFSVPIRHLGFNGDNTVTTETKTDAEGNETTTTTYALYDPITKEYNWENMQVGDLGVVRNHVYTMTVDEIGGLGTGLRSDDQPIVPAKKDVNQYVAMRLNVLQWRVVNEWHVSL